MDQIRIEPLSRTAIASAIGVLKDAFRDDPIFCFHFPDADLRARVLEIFFSDIVRNHMSLKHVYAAFDGNKAVGVAVWRPPNAADRSLKAKLRSLLARGRLLALSPSARKLLRGFAALEATHPAAPHWYLFFIGVSKQHRGQGIGARLMQPVLKLADGSGIPCYLETPFPQTLPFYRRLGYDVVSEPRPFAGAPQLWAMIRQPRLPT